MYRRVNVFGGPGSGKSTLAAYIFYYMKMNGYEVEHVQEYVKKMVYDQRVRTPFDQLKIMSRQVEREERYLASSDSMIIVTDCPITMTLAYAKEVEFPAWKALLDISLEFDKKYPTLNICIDRSDLKYIEEGRFQNYDEAKRMDKIILDLVYDLEKETGYPMLETAYTERDRITSFIDENVSPTLNIG